MSAKLKIKKGSPSLIKSCTLKTGDPLIDKRVSHGAHEDFFSDVSDLPNGNQLHPAIKNNPEKIIEIEKIDS